MNVLSITAIANSGIAWVRQDDKAVDTFNVFALACLAAYDQGLRQLDVAEAMVVQGKAKGRKITLAAAKKAVCEAWAVPVHVQVHKATRKTAAVKARSLYKYAKGRYNGSTKAVLIEACKLAGIKASDL